MITILKIILFVILGIIAITLLVLVLVDYLNILQKEVSNVAANKKFHPKFPLRSQKEKDSIKKKKHYGGIFGYKLIRKKDLEYLENIYQIVVNDKKLLNEMMERSNKGLD